MERVTTKRLIITPITTEQLRIKIDEEPAEEMKQAYSEMLEGCIKMPEQHIWYTVWFMQLQDGDRPVIGDLSFKGLQKDGSVEIGYGIKPEYQGRGLATEAVTAMTRWAITQPGVLRVEAETEPNNIASRRVLEKSGFVPNGIMGEEGPRFVKSGGEKGIF